MTSRRACAATPSSSTPRSSRSRATGRCTTARAPPRWASTITSPSPWSSRRCRRCSAASLDRAGKGDPKMTARPIPQGMHSVTPHLVCAGGCPEWGSVGPKSLKGSPVTIHLYVDDADAFVARAQKAGAKVTMPVEEQFWGDRYGKIEDPFGHHWSVGTHVRDVTPEEMKQAMQKMAGPGHP